MFPVRRLRGSGPLYRSLTPEPDELPEGAEVLFPPSLDSCINLSELVLNMKGSYSCIVETPGTIFATLLDPGCPNLHKITLEAEDAKSLFLPEIRGECSDAWKYLDAALSMLAEKLMSARGKKLIFIMEVTCRNDTIRKAKKWVPRLLPVFKREGSLHVHDGEDDACRGREYDEEDEKACMGRAVLKEYGYESESDETTDEGDEAGGEGEEKENKDEEVDEGNEGDDENENENEKDE
jgi:hypothetical protein